MSVNINDLFIWSTDEDCLTHRCMNRKSTRCYNLKIEPFYSLVYQLCNVFEVVCLVFAHSIQFSSDFKWKSFYWKLLSNYIWRLRTWKSSPSLCIHIDKVSLPSSNVKSKAKITIKFIAFTELVRKYAQGQSWRLSFQHSSLWLRSTMTKTKESLICL